MYQRYEFNKYTRQYSVREFQIQNASVPELNELIVSPHTGYFLMYTKTEEGSRKKSLKKQNIDAQKIFFEKIGRVLCDDVDAAHRLYSETLYHFERFNDFLSEIEHKSPKIDEKTEEVEEDEIER